MQGPAVPPPRGSVVLAHGLNTTPEVMADLAAVLGGQGYVCEPVALHPPRVTGRQSPDDVAAGWRQAFADAVARALTRDPHLPVSAVGYSLGGLVAVLHAAASPTDLQGRLVLWAPPLALTRSAAAVRLLTPAHRSGVRLPSAAPSRARARWATPLAEYAALLGLVEEAAALPRSVLERVATLVLLEPGDPLVDHTGVTDWVRRRGLDRWVVEPISGRGPTSRPYRHLVVSKVALGEQAWARATTSMLAHLEA